MLKLYVKPYDAGVGIEYTACFDDRSIVTSASMDDLISFLLRKKRIFDMEGKYVINLAEKNFKGAESVLEKSHSDSVYWVYNFGGAEIYLCHSGLCKVFGHAPKNIYFNIDIASDEL